MGYRVRIQKVERPSNRSFYINFPSPIADAVGMVASVIICRMMFG